ncbi:MAG: glycosyltransferase family 2 protein [Dermatophilaceae bacterium]
MSTPESGAGGTLSTPTVADLLVVIPAWNEEAALPSVLQELSRVAPDTPVVVVSDGSRDGTAAVARRHAVPVIELPFNLGVGGAMRAGFVYAQRHGFSYVAQLDADGQHDPAELAALCDAMRQTGADVVVGSRFHGDGNYRVRGPRRWAMVSLAAAISRIARTRLTDITSGYKLLGPRAVALFAREYPVEYLGDTVEALVLAVRAGLLVRQTPVHMRRRQGGEPSHSPIKAAVFLVRATLSVSLAMTRPRLRETGHGHGA